MTFWLLGAILIGLLWVGTLATGWQDANDQWARVSWLTIGCGVLMALASPNPWIGMLLVLFVTGIIFMPPMILLTMNTVMPTLVFAATYLLIAPYLTPTFVVPILFGMMGVGMALTGWAIYAFHQPEGRWERFWANGLLGIWERDTAYPMAGQGNWNHTQSVGALAVAANLALVWLGQTWTAWLLPLTAGNIFLCVTDRSWLLTASRWQSQGMLHFLTALLVFVGLWLGGWWLVGLLAAYIGILLVIGKPWRPRWEWIDSGRFWSWHLGIRELWWHAFQPPDPLKAVQDGEQRIAESMQLGQQFDQERQQVEAGTLPLPEPMTVPQYLSNWQVMFQQWNMEHFKLQQAMAHWVVLAKVRQKETLTPAERRIYYDLWLQRWRVWLLGFGTHSWFALTKIPTLQRTGKRTPDGRIEGMVFCTAHSEFVEWWFEHGAIGLAVLLGFISTTLWSLYQAGPLGQAVLILAVTLCSVAAINFPWTLFQEVHNESQPVPVQYIGAPSLLIFSFVIALLAAAVTG